MALSDEQIKQLLEWFISSSANYRKYNPLRKQALIENHKWIQPEIIKELSDEELEKRFLDYYNSNTGDKQNLNKLNRDRIIRDKAKFRETIAYLLMEEIPIEARVNEVLKGKYRINGFGRGIMSAFLMDFNPDRYCLWNRKTEMGFEVLGWGIRERGDSPGAEYEKVLNALQKLRRMRPDLNLTLNDVDFFLHTISAEDEGKKAVKSLAGVRIPGLVDIIHGILKQQPKNWALSRDFFHSFYHDQILEDKNGWNREAVGRVLQKLSDYEKKPGINLTEALLEGLSDDSEGHSVLKDLIDLVKVCDRKAYKQDYSLPVLGRPFVRQNIYYEKILKWKLEARGENIYEDILKSIILTSSFKNIFLYLYEPQNYVPMVSQVHRRWFIQNFIDSTYDFDDDDSEKACIESNELIKEYFKKELSSNPELLEKLTAATLSDHFFTRVIVRVMYHDNVRYLWDKRAEDSYLLFSFKEESPWDDELEESYQYGSTVPNYKKVRPGVNFVLFKKNVGFIGHGVVGEIATEDSEVDGPQIMRAYYESFEAIHPPRELAPEIQQKLTSIKGYNVQHSIKLINKEIYDLILTPTAVKLLPDPIVVRQTIYTHEDFVNDTGFEREVIAGWEQRLHRKMHVVFQGPPGTGKTYVAERLARLMVSETTGFWDVVQFHPAYAYEDFIQGIRPKLVEGAITYELAKGRFLEFCSEADKKADGGPCVLIIDEINRAHLSRVFGELMYLLEYRDKEIPLAAGGDSFRIPENVYLVGTMNTADRSIALVDHALRRRFSFIRLSPDYGVLRKHLEGRGHPADQLIGVLREINNAIDDFNYELGISFFMRDDDLLKTHLPDIWRGEIEPYLEEFFYDQPGKVTPFRWETLAENRLKEWAD